MNINWFPGHMKKATDRIKIQFDQVDLSCEVLDARIPDSSRNRALEAITASKPRLIILNKADLADPDKTKAWMEALEKKDQSVLALNARDEDFSSLVEKRAKVLCRPILEKRREKGLQNREIRMMVFGIPNSGKSTFINKLSGRKSAKTGDRPGVTTANQWIKTPTDLLLLDTPGIMVKKMGPTQGLHLSWTGAIKEEVLNLQEIGYAFINFMVDHYGEVLADRYDLPAGLSGLEAMDRIGGKMGAIVGGYTDYDRVSARLLDDFQKGKLGRISLENPEDKDEA